ncbi:hypothetical protein AMTR_s00096p00019400 [Amborella trichopoda]|uniref:Pentacotripeptide-repeat region of PRORP domain-containing protein n=1 Tax=Amborella trichopoda TaxID=13333 RepID=W1NXK2_AMBTC|nr:hypothetical protein AMTR_s00096p00019400 [Amborella trichopoda]
MQCCSDETQIQSSLDELQLKISPDLINRVFQNCIFSSNSAYALFVWAQKQPNYSHTTAVLNSMVNLFGRMREFDSAWLLIDSLKPLVNAQTFTILLRRYARAGLPQAALRTLDLIPHFGLTLTPDSLNNILDALCKEGQVREAARYFEARKSKLALASTYNILLHGWFRLRNLRKAERLWEDMQVRNVPASVVTYGTLIEGYCRMRRVERALELLEDMKFRGIEPNVITYNPIVDALGEAGRHGDAMAMTDRIFTLGLTPTISTYNSLVKGFSKHGDMVGASKVLKMMIGRGCLPTPTTYNYFFKFFSRAGKIDEGMNLYTKLIKSGYSLDRLSYQLLIKMLCEKGRLEMTLQVIEDMHSKGYDSDLATSSMLVHLLCNLGKLEEACEEFEGMINKGIVPQYLTFQMLVDEVRRLGLVERARRLTEMMDSVPHSKKLPNSYKGGDVKKSILEKAQGMCDLLKVCNDPRKLVKRKGSTGNVVADANQIILDMRNRSEIDMPFLKTFVKIQMKSK